MPSFSFDTDRISLWEWCRLRGAGLFGLDWESLSVNVRATNRDCYASGALAAAAFLVGQPAGLYSMRDVLGLSAG